MSQSTSCHLFFMTAKNFFDRYDIEYAFKSYSFCDLLDSCFWEYFIIYEATIVLKIEGKSFILDNNNRVESSYPVSNYLLYFPSGFRIPA